MAKGLRYAKVMAPLALATVCALLTSCGSGKSAKKSKTPYVIRVPQGYSPVARSVSEDKAKLLQLMNQYRKQKGRAPLLIDDRLMRAAQSHSEAMNRHKNMSHVTKGEKSLPKRLQKVGYPQVYFSENIANARGAEMVNRLWTESPGHRRNLLGKRYTRVGIGLSGRYWTANYAEAVGPPSGTSSMPPPARSYTGSF